MYASQFVGMLFCQLGRAHSLREIEGGLKSCEGKLVHLGIEVPARSSLSYVNGHRPWQLYEITANAPEGVLNIGLRRFRLGRGHSLRCRVLARVQSEHHAAEERLGDHLPTLSESQSTIRADWEPSE